MKECARCSARLVNGKRCTRKTCLYAHQCWQHTMHNSGVAVMKSNIPEAGKGLFAVRDLPSGTMFPYLGRILTQDQVDGLYGQGDSVASYVYKTRKGVCIDASGTQSCLARYINDTKGTNNEPNCRWVEHRNGKVSVVTTRPVFKGEELYVDYGDSYWEK